MPHGRAQHTKKQRALVPSAVKLSSGQSLPRRVDLKKLYDTRQHPLTGIGPTRSLSSLELEGDLAKDKRRKISDLQKIKENQGANQMTGEDERTNDVMDLVLKDVLDI